MKTLTQKIGTQKLNFVILYWNFIRRVVWFLTASLENDKALKSRQLVHVGKIFIKNVESEKKGA